MENVTIIYTDGGCHNESGDKHGIGSWAYLEPVDLSNDVVKVYTQYVEDTTNNRTEMLAILNAIMFSQDTTLEIYSDSGYVVKGYNDPAYLDRWIINGWRTSTKKPVLNQDLWEQFKLMPWEKRFHLNLIKGHKKDSNPIHSFWNDICDQVCTYTMDNIRDNEIHCVTYNLQTKEITEDGK